MEEEWYRTYLSQHGMPLSRDAKFVLASTIDRPLPKNAMKLVVSQTWQNFHVENTSVHVTRSPTGGNLAEKCLQPRSYRVESPSGRILYRRTGAKSARKLRSTYLNIDDDPQRDTRETVANGPRSITVEPHVNSSESSTAEPVEPPVVTPASVEPAEELAGSPSRRISDKRVRFQPEQKSYYTRSGRLSKPQCQYNV